MAITFHKTYILIASHKVVNVLGVLTGMNGKNGHRQAMGFALFPCIIVLRSVTHPKTKEWINHERIHIRQNIETLCLVYLFSKLEYLYARLILKYPHTQAYLYECTEQEAYLNQGDSEYLKNRKIFAVFKYIRNKEKFFLDEHHNVIR